MSNNVTPIRQQVPQQQDWWFQPPQVWPPQQPCPPPQQCAPQPPSCFSQVAQANACWDQSQSLYNLVSKVVMDIFATNPGIIPPPPVSAGSGPRLGVTDGSNAQPGQIGEFIRYAVNVPFAAAVVTDVSVPVGVIQPGDWTIWAGLDLGVGTGPTSFYVNVATPGLSNGLHAAMGTFAGTDESDWSVINGPVCRASFTVPTVMNFRVVIVNNLAGNAAGNATMWIEARRAR